MMAGRLTEIVGFCIVTCNLLDIAMPMPLAERVQKRRAALRAAGLRPIQIWVPDTRAPAFRAEARRQSKAVAASTKARADQRFIDAVSD